VGDTVENGPSDFLPLSRVRLLNSWQSGWDGSDLERYAYFIWPMVSFMPWFRHFNGNRVILSMMKRMMTNYSCLRSHLGRIGIEENLCSRGYETVDHVLWGCDRFDAEKLQLGIDLRLPDTE
jgi:hypothetical protein